MLHLTTTTWRGHGLLVVWRANLGWPVFGWGSAYCRFALHNMRKYCICLCVFGGCALPGGERRTRRKTTTLASSEKKSWTHCGKLPQRSQS